MKEENEKEDYEAGEEEGAKEAGFLPGRCICRLMKAFCGQEQEQGILLGGYVTDLSLSLSHPHTHTHTHTHTEGAVSYCFKSLLAALNSILVELLQIPSSSSELMILMDAFGSKW